MVLDIQVPDASAERLIEAWRREILRMLPALGWEHESTAERRFPGGASLALSAPIDCLFTATEVNEWALESAEAAVFGSAAPDFPATAIRLRQEIEAERKPRLLALRTAATDHGVSLLADPHLVSIGTGTGSLTWKIEELPLAESIDWSKIHDVPAVLITGSNGKTTSTRLLTAVLTNAGRVAGMCCTDGVTVAGELVSRGDWAGPGGARMVLQDRRVEVAVLETARGGILRRGLAVERATAALVTNIAEDHFGEFGIHGLDDLAEAKLVVAKALSRDGILVLNADDPTLVNVGPSTGATIGWFSLDASNPVIRKVVATGGRAVWVENGEIRVAGWNASGSGSASIARVDEIPITMKGVARHNVANALGVTAAALALGVEPAMILRGLLRFSGSSMENPGRLNLFDLGGVSALADFAHNPHGMDALVRMANALPATRRLLVLGQAGDRDDAAIQEFARSAWAFRPNRIVLKEMEPYRRGRPVGEVTEVMRREFIRLGVNPASIVGEPSEYDALLAALRWAQAGDVLLLPLHAERERGLDLLDRLQRIGWKPGDVVE